MDEMERALSQIRALKKERKILNRQLQERRELISILLEATERMETWIRSNQTII